MSIIKALFKGTCLFLFVTFSGGLVSHNLSVPNLKTLMD